MTLRIGTRETEFEALREPWQALFQSNPNHTPFQSWEWNHAWWKHFGVPGRLRLLIVEKEGRLIGIAPLQLALRYRGAPLRHLAFISDKRADYLDFIVAAGMEREFFAELFEFLRTQRGEWRFLTLRDVQETSTNLAHLLREGLRAFPHVNLEPAENCAAVRLPSTWEGYLSTLGKNARRNAIRYRKHLAEEFAVRWTAPTDPEEIRRCFDDFARVFRDRWGPEQGATFFDRAKTADFEREVCQLGTAAGWYRLYLVYANEVPVAGYLGYVCNGKFYAGLLAHSPALHKYSPGTVLIGMTIEDCIANRWTELDMTRGDEPYKLQWNGVLKRNYRIKLCDSRILLAYAFATEWVRERLESIRALHRLRAAYRRRLYNAPSGSLARAAGFAPQDSSGSGSSALACTRSRPRTAR